jgi:putative transposase
VSATSRPGWQSGVAAPSRPARRGCRSRGFSTAKQRRGITISNGKGPLHGWLWRSLKYEEVYLKAYASVGEAKAGIGSWLARYSEERHHPSLGYRTPRHAYEG